MHSHICCTHSLSSHPHTHTHTHTHTRTHTHTHLITQSKSGRYELIRFLEVEEIGFLKAFGGLLTVCYMFVWIIGVRTSCFTCVDEWYVHMLFIACVYDWRMYYTAYCMCVYKWWVSFLLVANVYEWWVYIVLIACVCESKVYVLLVASV